jgi:hypothetical protein
MCACVVLVARVGDAVMPFLASNAAPDGTSAPLAAGVSRRTPS